MAEWQWQPACQPGSGIDTKNANESDRDRFVSVVEVTLSDIVKNGLSKRMVKAGINYYEFKYREADFGPYPKGLMYYLTMMDSWLYYENKPFVHVEAGETFEIIKKNSENGFFEKFIEDNIIGNNHEVVLSLFQSMDLQRRRKQRKQSSLQSIRQHFPRKNWKSLLSRQRH